MQLSPFATLLRSLSRPQRHSFLNQQCRSIKLLHATLTNTSVGNHHIKKFSPVHLYTKTSKVKIDLWAEDDEELKPIGRMALSKALLKFGGPGKLLCPIENSDEEGQRADSNAEKSQEGPRRYVFKHITPKKPIKEVSFKIPNSKSFHFLSTAKNSYFEHCAAKIWQFMQLGILVEVQVHKKGHTSASEVEFEKMLNGSIHLRPDVLLAAMPKGSKIIVNPQTNLVVSSWVMCARNIDENGKEHKPKNITSKFYERQRIVTKVTAKLERLNAKGDGTVYRNNWGSIIDRLDQSGKKLTAESKKRVMRRLSREKGTGYIYGQPLRRRGQHPYEMPRYIRDQLLRRRGQHPFEKQGYIYGQHLRGRGQHPFEKPGYMYGQPWRSRGQHPFETLGYRYGQPWRSRGHHPFGKSTSIARTSKQR